MEPGPKFMGQFPYKSCQRSLTPKKVTGHKWPYNLAPASAPKRRVSLKRRQAAGRVEDSSFSHIPSASRPTSPDTQLEKLQKVAAEQREMTEGEVERYRRYLAEDIKEENIERMGKEQLEVIKAKCNHPAWFKSLMLKKKVDNTWGLLEMLLLEEHQNINNIKNVACKYSFENIQCAGGSAGPRGEGGVCGCQQGGGPQLHHARPGSLLLHNVFNLVQMWNQEERDRLNILVGPKMWGPRVVRAPVPWHQSFLQVVEIVEGGEGLYMDF